MSKITFRADEELVERLEAFDASKSEVMREALRAYLDDAEGDASDGDDASSIDEAIAERVDQLVEDRLDARLGAPRARSPQPAGAQDINVNVTLDGSTAGKGEATVEETAEQSSESERRKTDGANAGDASTDGRKTCSQCGENVSADHVYCPNCGEKATRRVFCDCGDELRSDWAFCPGCGRRTPAADVLDRS